MIKIFGVGNTLLCDDGIGVRVINKIQDRLRGLTNDIEVIIGGTDNVYCLDKIDDNDLVIIVDSTNLMMRPGLVLCRSFDQCDDLISELYTSSDDSLLRVLRCEKRDVRGFLIGIEVSKIAYSTELSKCLSNRFNSICEHVYDQILMVLGIAKFF